jgi:hypothetical protein
MVASRQDRALTHLIRQLRSARVAFTTLETAIMILAKTSTLPVLHAWQSEHPHVTVWGEESANPAEVSEQLRATWALWKIVAHHGDFLIRGPKSQFHLRDFPEISMLDTLLPAHRALYVTKILAPIAGDPELMKTLRAWILLNRSFKVAAECLHTHPNTIRYRIDRIAEMLGRNFQDDQAVMCIRLAVLWMDPEETGSL